jgi:hypothetical protein
MPDENKQPQVSMPTDNQLSETHDVNDNTAPNTNPTAGNDLVSQTQIPLTITDSSEENVLVTTTTASLPSTVDTANALRDFRSALLDLINASKPGNLDERSGRRVLGLFVPWYSKDFSYDELVAKYVGLWSVLEKRECQRYILQAVLGLNLLRSGRTSPASKIFREIEFYTSTPAALTYVMSGVAYFLRSAILLSITVAYTWWLMTYFLSSSPFLIVEDAPAKPGDPSLILVLVAAISGMLGSVVSLLLRLGEFESTKGRSQMFLTLTGATLPVVGGIFGAFVAALLSSKIINIEVGGSEGLSTWLYIVIGFLSGFSERFSRGFIRLAEDRLGSGDAPDTQMELSKETAITSAKRDVVVSEKPPAS